ncbi:MAG TPA: hypothetical protein VIE67_07230 [Rudaea sp.]|jgi:hypothetical protein|uniref:hypothetical protein n=1 Tax=Rudaea sp. TaxID=2136325 RepID=UPI002F94F6E4
MKRKSANPTIAAAMILFILLTSLTAIADPRPKFPKESCTAGPNQTCVDFADKDQGKLWQSSTPSSLLLWGTSNDPSIWDSHGFITLAPQSDPSSKCTQASDTWIQAGTRLMIQTDTSNSQTLFLLLPWGGMFIEKALLPNVYKGNIRWMSATIPGPLTHTYDYFVEFGFDSKHQTEKQYRVDAFPHWNTPPTTGNDYLCYLERPDRRTDWNTTSVSGISQTGTGTGNEPVH